ncbi:hypothetical protein Pint_26711 [Pistacia integerrima]|uniref:Uncharacterized protein n=1 Tax=Pistacia integerrima TaxID=434235 RepID=A0ACC0YM92_9ROSI|nr:hypothetical protein Pint_26711 [Pistacia integerrima]
MVGVPDSGVQLDVFQLVGLPLIVNCLAGFNSSAVAYGKGVERLIYHVGTS